MKQQFFLSFLILILLIGYLPSNKTATAQEKKPAKSFCVGDVRLSLLPPQEFQLKNGKGWVLMRPMSEEQISQNNYAEFFRATGLKNIPDARGVFLRGMNMGRDASSGDPDGDRIVGEPQGDEFKSHIHGTRVNYGGKRFAKWGLMYAENMTPFEKSHTAAEGGKETRPRNIAVYVYVKVY